MIVVKCTLDVHEENLYDEQQLQVGDMALATLTLEQLKELMTDSVKVGNQEIVRRLDTVETSVKEVNATLASTVIRHTRV